MSRAPGKYVAGTMAPAGAALDRPGLDGSRSIPGRGKRFSSLYIVRTGSGPTQLPIQWVPGAPPSIRLHGMMLN
jgi:hypothetical protein